MDPKERGPVRVAPLEMSIFVEVPIPYMKLETGALVAADFREKTGESLGRSVRIVPFRCLTLALKALPEPRF